MTVHDDRLHAEVDRQLGEIRSASDTLATRAGLLITATAVGATLVAARIDKLREGLVPTLWVLGVATVSGVFVLWPWLKIAPKATSLQDWMSGGATATTTSKLYDAKASLLRGNMQRLAVMRLLFSLQALATLVATVLALSYSARK